MTEKVIVVGDIHMNWNALFEIIAYAQPDLIISVGDFGFWPGQRNEYYGIIPPEEAFVDNETKILFCPGNHEHWDRLDYLAAGRIEPIEVAPNVFYMPRGSTYKLADGRIILFYGGANSIDKHTRSRHISWFEQEIPSAGEIKKLPNTKIDILITHTCPERLAMKLSGGSLDKDQTRKDISYIYEHYNPAIHFFGHWHYYSTGMLNNTKWHCLSFVDDVNKWWMLLP